MISEALQFLSDPSGFEREQAEDRWENRFIETEITCKHCEGWGSRLEDAMEIRKCNAPGCRGGSIYTALCSRCGKDENGCQCSVEDFK